MWRVDIDDASTSNWKVWKIAAVASRGSTPSARKFQFSPDIVPGVGGTFDAVVIGSGDREHPLSSNGANGVVNRVYMFADTAMGMTGANLGITDTCGASVGGCTNLFDATNDPAVPADAKGWFITLAAGEKVINGALVVANNMVFGTNQPDPSNLTCTGNLGIARRYAVNVLTGAASAYTNSSGTLIRGDIAPGGGFLPSPVVAGSRESAGITRAYVTDNPLNPGGITSFVVNVPTKRFRTYWREALE